MRYRYNVGVYLLCAFFVLTLGTAFFFNRNFPVLVVASESSVGTWISGVLLTCCAAIALVISIHQGWHPWVLLKVFFFFLAADEHFMFHERMKEWIIFSYRNAPVIMRESPVMVGALIGGWVSWMLWSRVKRQSRGFLLGAVLLGLASVILDVIGSSALWEESFKLTAELAIVCALLVQASTIGKAAPDKAS
jgi:hypothetical protein